MPDDIASIELPGERREPPTPKPEAAAKRAQWTPGRRRAWVLAAFFAFGALAYALALVTLDLAQEPSERTFVSGPEGRPRLKIYVEPLAVDPVSDAMQIRIDVTPSGAFLGKRPDAPNRDLTLLLTHDETAEVLTFRADQTTAPANIRVSLNDGSITHYPFDRYHADLGIEAFEGTEAAPESQRALPEEVTVWQGALGYQVRAAAAADNRPAAISLRIGLRRAAAHVFFALAAYAAMVVLAGSSLTISCFVFLGHRKMESTLVGALAALVFALPALRNTIPGAPPLGVWPDLAVFLWAELAVVFGLALLVASWAGLAPKQ